MKRRIRGGRPPEPKQRTPRDAAVICPCGSKMILRNTRLGKFYLCIRYPECRENHGAHQKTGAPLGMPADASTRKARTAAHSAFDKIWKSEMMTKSVAYVWLARKMGITIEECHIGNFDKATCLKVVNICEELTCGREAQA